MSSGDVFFFVDEAGTNAESEILLVTCVITHNPGYIRTRLNGLRDSCQRDPSMKTIPSVQKLSSERGFHYCEDHQEVRSKVIDLIHYLNFEAYICYQHKEYDFCSNDGYTWYDDLFGRLMFDRLQAHLDSKIQICFEQHDNKIQTRRDELNGIIDRLIDNIKSRYDRDFYIHPEITSAGKEEPCLTLPDYIAGMFCSYFPQKGCQETWQSRNFLKIRPKLRVIHNYTTGEFHTHKNPFP